MGLRVADRATTVVGVDPGTAITGYGVVQRGEGGGLQLLECGVVRTAASDPLALRLRDIFTELTAILERFEPDCVAVEDVFQGRGPRSAITLGHARGAILLASAMAEITVAEYTPAQIKKAVVGTGKATKDQVGYMVQQQLRLRAQPRPADAADGVAVALCHCLMGDFAARVRAAR